MKPDWKDAPEWANWLAMDPDGGWCWFEKEPWYSHSNSCWFHVIPSKYQEAQEADREKHLEQRP